MLAMAINAWLKPPVPSELAIGWLQPSVRAMIAKAVYVEAAIAAGGIWRSASLENKISNPTQKTKAGCRGRTNKYRGMRDGKHYPNRSTISEIRRAFPSADVEGWWMHPVFYLLNDLTQASQNQKEAVVFYALSSVLPLMDAQFSGSVLLHDALNFSEGNAVFFANRKQIQEILDTTPWEELHPISQFVLSASLGIKATILNERKLTEACSHKVYGSVIETVVTCPHIMISWPEFCERAYFLFSTLEPSAFSRGYWPPFNPAHVERHMDLARRLKDVVLPESLTPRSRLLP